MCTTKDNMSLGDIHTISSLSSPSLKNISKQNCKILGGLSHTEDYFCFLQPPSLILVISHTCHNVNKYS